MQLINSFAKLLVIFASSYVVYPIPRSGHMARESHPMLASVFQVVNNIRSLSGGPRPGMAGQSITAADEPLFETSFIRGRKDHRNTVEVTPVDPLTVDENLLFPSTGLESLVRPDVFSTLNTNSGSRAPKFVTRQEKSGSMFNRNSPHDSMSIAGLSADMLCSLCRQRGNEECIVIHCSNDRISNIISGVPMFESQIDRHDLLQLTNIKIPAEQNVIGTSDSSHQPLKPTNPIKKTTAPIWLMADSMANRLDIAPPTMAEINQPNELMRTPPSTINFSVTDGHLPKETITNGLGNPHVVFIDGNVGSSLPIEHAKTRTGVGSESTQTPSLLATTGGIDAQPLDVPTEIFLQLVRNDLPTFMKSLEQLQHMNFARPSSTDTNSIGDKVLNGNRVTSPASNIFAKKDSGNTFSFPAGFEEGTVINPQTDVTTTSRFPDIPRAVDMFPIVNSDKNSVDKQTLVIKNHGKGEKVAVHVGHGPFPDNVIDIMEMRGHNSDATLTSTPSLDLHSLLNPLNDPQNSDVKQNMDHSQHVVDHKHSDPNGNQQDISGTATNSIGHRHISEHTEPAGHNHSPLVDTNSLHPASGLKHDLMALQSIHVDSELSERITTTTPVPTINPIRKAALNKFSEHLLSGIHL